MKPLLIIWLLLGLLTLTACQESQKPKIENPMKGYTKALEKAKQVEGILLEAAEKRRKAID